MTMVVDWTLIRQSNFYVKNEMEWSDGNGRLPEVFIVDFATNELYAIGNHRVGFWIRDFWIRVDHKENEEEIMAIYAPEGKME